MEQQKTIVVTGSQTGMGLAARHLPEAHGARIIGLFDTEGAEVRADLSQAKETQRAVADILDLCDGMLDGFFANAGVDNENAQQVFAVNYFSIVNMLQALQAPLSRSRDGRVVINASNSVVITPGIPRDVVEALLRMDAPLACQLIAQSPEWTYQCSKTAITRWARQQAPRKEWAGSSISMNVIAPGVVKTRLIEKDRKIRGRPQPSTACPIPSAPSRCLKI